jgi:2-iminobutanoate/2-iminopropanoate deaminase
MIKEVIYTQDAPKPIGTYSQAIKAGQMVFLSAQAPLVPETMEVVEGGIEAQINRAFDNLNAVAKAAGATLDNAVKITVYLTDLSNFALVNQKMSELFSEPYPARAAIGAKSLPKGTDFAVEAILHS